MRCQPLGTRCRITPQTHELTLESEGFGTLMCGPFLVVRFQWAVCLPSFDGSLPVVYEPGQARHARRLSSQWTNSLPCAPFGFPSFGGSSAV